MGDGRTYDHVCALRAVTSVDGMTADFFPYDMNFLGRAATRIINEVKGVNRVVYDVTASRRARSSGSRGNGGNRRHRRPARRMLAFVIQNHPHNSGADLGGEFVRRLARHGSILTWGFVRQEAHSILHAEIYLG